MRVINAKKTTYAGSPALVASVQFTSTKRVGALLAHVTVALGTATAALNRTFTLKAA